MTIYDFHARSIDGREIPLSNYAGRVLLIVNVASQCGLTYHYEGLESLYRRYHDRGFDVLGFPCNQFRGQEPGNEAEIMSFCQLNYDVTFPMFSKIKVNGPGADPLFAFLKKQKRGIFGSDLIKWNFTKFLVDREGHVAKRFGPRVLPRDIEPELIRRLS